MVTEKQKKVKVEPLLFDSYLAMIKNSVGTNLFRNFYAKINGKKKDVTKDGDGSCVFFVSAILTLMNLLEEIHLIVAKTVKDMEKSGWYKIKKPRAGAVIVWKKSKHYDEKHIGFYVGRGIAISNSSSESVPKNHHWTFDGKRKVEAIYWHRKLKRSK